MKLTLAIILLTIGCTKNKVQSAVASRLPELAEKAALYMDLMKEARDKDGWILADECDALLHSSLASVGGGVDYQDLKKARNEAGQWFRRPSKDCLATGSSKSTISRDMLLGLLIAVQAAKDADTSAALVEYALDNVFVMGQNDGSVDGINRVLVTPTFYRLMTQVNDSMAGRLTLTETDRTSEVGFTDHLAALAIYLRGELYGEIGRVDLNTIRDFTERDPNNALYWAIRGRYDPDMGGDQSRAVHILLRPDLFPTEGLPTSSDRKTAYLWMHGENPNDWNGDGKGTPHFGHDLTFAAWVIIHD